MRRLGIWVLGLLASSAVVQAGVTPALYCVSTKTFKAPNTWPVNQINIFTNEKGSLRMSLQFHAWGQSEEENANITTDKLLGLTRLSFDETSQELKNKSRKFVLKLNEEISPAEAKRILAAKNVNFDFEDPAGMLLDFKKYHMAKIKKFDYPGDPKKWSSTLMDAFKAGVNEYVCGDFKDIDRSRSENGSSGF